MSASSVGDGHPGSSTRLSGQLGVFSIVFMVVAAAAPLTILISTPVNMLNGNGPGIAFSYIAGPLIMLIFGFGYAAMSVHVKKAGAFYSYITEALGRPVGVGAGFMALLGYLLFQSFVYLYLGMATNGLLASIIGHGLLPWWGWTLVAMAIVSVLTYFHVELSAKVLSVALLLEVLAVIVLNVSILVKGGGPQGIQVAPYFSLNTITSGSLPLGLLFGIAVALGFEATALFRDEAREPARTIPRAIFITIVGAAVFYGFSAWAWMQAFGERGVMDAVAQDPSNIVYATAGQWVGHAFEQILYVLAITSMFACVLAYQNIATRYLHSMGHSVLPRVLTTVHPQHRSPYVASVVTSAIALTIFVLILISGQDPVVIIGWEIALGTFSPLVLFMLTAVAIFIFFRRNRGLPVSRWSSTIAPAISVVVLGAIALTALLNFETLSGASSSITVLLQVTPVVVFLLGVGVALWAKRKDPCRYAGLADRRVGETVIPEAPR